MNSTQETVLRAIRLSKRYPNGTVAVRDLSLELHRGEVLGLAGLKLIAGLLRPASGTIEAIGRDVTGAPDRAARFIALMPDPLGVYTDVSSREYLHFFAGVYGHRGAAARRIVDDTAARLGLGPWMDSEVETLSAGWQRRLALGRALIADAPIMLLDEPAAGLDVGARAELLTIVRTLAKEGRTMIVSSHILPELEDLADRFAVMIDGRWAEVSPGKSFFTREDLRHGFSSAPEAISVRGDAATLDRAREALDAAGIPFEEVGTGLEEAVLGIIRGDVAK